MDRDDLPVKAFTRPYKPGPSIAANFPNMS